MCSELEGAVAFLARLIQTPSLPGEEGAIARLVRDEMDRLGFDETSIDPVGNVLGLVRGRGRAPAIQLDTHLDHVDVGDPAAWPYPPYGGELHAGAIWGRGAVDIKGPLAAQVYAAASLAAGDRPPGDVWVTAVVQEEIGGLGAAELAPRLQTPWVIVGEPSSNELRRGHRGRLGIEIVWRGRSAHASAPDRGTNPLASAGRFLDLTERLDLPDPPELGAATLAPTLLTTDQTSPNVLPGAVRLTCDRRSLPGEDPEAIRAELLALARGVASPGVEVEARIPAVERRTWTGETRTVPARREAYLVEADDPALTAAAEVLERRLERPVRQGFWRFASDGGLFAAAGRTALGFGPGDETLAHTVDERLPVAALEEAIAGYRALAAELPARIAGRGRRA